MITEIIRKLHLYLGLFFIPWMLIYALSGITLNHRELFKHLLHLGPPQFTIEKEQFYNGTFPDNAGPRMMAGQILSDIGLDGAHGVRSNKSDGTLTIWRNDPLKPRRLTYNISSGNLIIEREVLRTVNFLRRTHFRRGYGQKYILDDIWAFLVDGVIFSIIFWGISGVWMWWKMKSVRKWGAVCLTAGAGLFLLFLFTI